MPTFNLEAFWASVENWIALHPGSFLAILAMTTACACVAMLHFGEDERGEMDDAPPAPTEGVPLHIRRIQIPVQNRDEYAALVEQCKQRAVDAKAAEQRAIDSLPRAQAEVRAILAKRRGDGNEAA